MSDPEDAERARCLRIAEEFLHSFDRPVISFELLEYYRANVIDAIRQGGSD